MALDWQRIRHMASLPADVLWGLAKWVCIFCFEMKDAAMFDWTVLRYNHLICIKCFKKNADFLKTMRSCHCGATFPESAYEYIVTYTHSGKVAAEEIS